MTDYFNLLGQHINHVPDGNNAKKMVITKSTNTKKVEASISKGRVISRITPSEMEQIKDIYKFDSEKKSGREQGYKRGTDGSTSKTITDEKGLWDDKASLEASKDLAAKGTTATSDEHLHNLDFDNKGNVTHTGSPFPSGGDITDEGTTSYTEPSMILGYEEKPNYPKLRTIGGKQQ